MSLSFYQKLTILFLIFFIGIGVIGFLAFRNNAALTNSNQRVEHTHKVLTESEKIIELTQSIANGDRSYVLTNDSEFLQPFLSARAEIFVQIGKLRDLTADNAIQQSRIDTINYYAQKRVDFAGQIINMVNKGDREGAVALIKTKVGQRLGATLRKNVTELQNEENRLLIQRKTATEKSVESFNRLLWGLFAWLLILLVISYIGFKYNYSMQSRLENELKSTNHFLNAILENIPNMIFVKDAEHLRFVRFNRAGEKLLGTGREELIGKNDYDFFPKKQADWFVSKDKEVLLNGSLLDIQEEIIQTKDGQKWLHTKKIPITDQDGKPQFLLGISEDITDSRRRVEEIKQLNAELEKTVAQLVTANKEMEAFTYSVSHDLRAPLRIIDGFGEILAKDYSQAFDEEGLHTLDVIMGNARHMGQLIDDLLNLSRLGRAQLAVKNVNMRELVEDVIQAMSIMDPQMARADIRVHALRSCECDVSLIRQVWTNLISNAVKYSRKKENPVIDIGWQELCGQAVYYIKDNGVGFDMKYYKKLFGVFQRLHKISEFEGTGVGLALVSRIITKHGGKIWAEATENEGAAFYFTLPKVSELRVVGMEADV